MPVGAAVLEGAVTGAAAAGPGVELVTGVFISDID